MNGVERTNMGLAHTMVEDAGRSGMDPSQIPNLFTIETPSNHAHPIKSKHQLSWSISNLLEGHPGEED
jgi:hypothetical protein